jgi:hypothetical protein
VERIKEYQARLTEFLTLYRAELLLKIAQEKALSDALAAELRAAADAFKQSWK